MAKRRRPAAAAAGYRVVASAALHIRERKRVRESRENILCVCSAAAMGCAAALCGQSARARAAGASK